MEIKLSATERSEWHFWSFSMAGCVLAELHLKNHWVKIDSGGKTLTDIDYRVRKMKYGKLARDWVVERQYVKTNKDSRIVNDANDWAVNTMKNPRYPLELFQRVITVSLETMKIVRCLPGLAI